MSGRLREKFIIAIIEDVHSYDEWHEVDDEDHQGYIAIVAGWVTHEDEHTYEICAMPGFWSDAPYEVADHGLLVTVPKRNIIGPVIDGSRRRALEIHIPTKAFRYKR